MDKIFPTHLNEFLQCRHIITLRKEGRKGDDFVSEELELLQNMGHRHEEAFLESLSGDVAVIEQDASPEEQKKMTVEAMQQGADYIYQGYMEHEGLAGYSDFLEKVPGKSALGDYSYEVIDTKLARRASAGNAVQLIHYAELAAQIQKKDCDNIHLVHGDNRRNSLKRDDYIDYYHELVGEFKRFLQSEEKTRPSPVKFCSSCRYRTLCNDFLEENDDVSRVSHLNVNSLTRLRKKGINTLSALTQAGWPQDSGISQSAFREIQQQAKAQKLNCITLRSRAAMERLAVQAKNSVCLTFFRQIQPVNGAFTFFAGILTAQGRFEYLTMHNSDDEKAAFERITGFVMRYLDNFPETVVFTFSNADLSLIHDLSNRYNICHDDIDDLIRREKLVALQPSLRQSLYIPIHRYSLVNLVEIFDSKKAAEMALAGSPHILYDLYDSEQSEEKLKRIIDRGRLELESIRSVLDNSAALISEEFPVKLQEESVV